MAGICQGHEPGPNEPMGISVYCDGSCATAERIEVTYEVELSIPEDGDGEPTAEEIAIAIYQGVRGIDSADAVFVRRI